MQFTAIGGADNSNRLINAKKGEGYGLELDGDIYLGAGFSLAAGGAWNHTEIKDKDLATSTCSYASLTPTSSHPIVAQPGAEEEGFSGG